MKFIRAFILVFLLSFSLFAKDNLMSEITTISSFSLYNLDSEMAKKSLIPFLKTHQNIKAVKIIDNTDNSVFLELYRVDNTIIYDELPQDILALKEQKSNVAYDDEIIGEIIIYINDQSIKLTSEEKKWIKNNVVTFGVEQWSPIVFSNTGDDIDGIAGDFTKIIVKKTGLNIKIINKEWSTILEDFKNKKIDVLPATYFTENRATYGLYSQSYFKMKNYLYVKEENNDIHSFSSLNNRKLAIIKGYGTLDKIKEKFPDIEIVLTKDLGDSINMVLSGEADALYEGQVAVDKKTTDELITGLRVINEQAFDVPELHYFINSDKTILLSIISKVLDSITSQERISILTKWVSFSKTINLSDSELSWLNKDIEIKYAFKPEWKPLEYSDELEEHRGIISDIIKLIKQKSGINIRPIYSTSWTEAVEKVKNKNLDAFSVGETKEKKEYLDFTKKSILRTPYVFVTRQGDDYLDGFKDAKNQKIAVLGESTIHHLLKENMPDLKLIITKSDVQELENLMDSKVDVVIINAITAKYYLNSEKYKNLKIAYKTKFNLDLKFALRKYFDNEALSIINKSLSVISEKEMSDIVDKWTSAQVQIKTDWLFLAEISIVVLLIVFFVLWNNKKLKYMVEDKTIEIRMLLNAFDKNVIASKTDKHGVITYVSKAFCEISGYTQEELIGKKHNLMRHPDMPDKLFKDMWETIKNEKVWRGEVKNIKKDGEFYWADTIITPECAQDGINCGFSAIRQDITAKKEVEDLTINLERKVEAQTKDIKKQLRIVKIAERKQQELIKEIEAIHKHTKESIEYASLIQDALIPDRESFKDYFKDYFAIWHPKDTIGGDIYLFEELRDNNECLLMVIDCTGHGVPGAFVTMLVKAIERQIVSKIKNSEEVVSPANLLSVFNKSMKHLLKQDNKDSISNAGFDGGIIYYNKKDKIIKFAGAETALYYMENNELMSIKGDRYSVGYKKCLVDYEYKDHIINVKDGMQFYLTTDGYLDQNGGNKGFPFGKKRFKKIIEECHNETMADQQEIFLNILDEYQGTEETNDDITLVGIQI